MDADTFESCKFSIYILGAGFSREAGLPLGKDLWWEVRRRAESMHGRAERFHDDLQTFIDFKAKCDGIQLKPDDVDFEEFLGFLDIEFYLGLRGSDTWSDDGNETQLVVKTLIGQIITEQTPSRDAIPDLYIEFAKLLRPEDYVITFNYDIVLERALEAIGKPYRLFPNRFKEVYPHHGVVDNSVDEVVVLKLHGSVDWFDRRSYRESEVIWKNQGHTAGPSHPIFNPNISLDVVSLVDGPKLEDDPLGEIHRVRDIEQVYLNPSFFTAPPTLIVPSNAKVLSSRQFRNFWWGMGSAGHLNFGMAIIGFSLPEHDDYARQAIYRLVRNYQQSNWDKEVFGKTKAPLMLIDFSENEEWKKTIMDRYSFIDRTRAKIDFGGFRSELLVDL